MDILTIVVSSLSALIVGVITAYVTNRLTIKSEREKQNRLLAERFTEFSYEDAEKAEKLAKQFAVAFLAYLPKGSKRRKKVFIPSSGRVLVGRSRECDLVLNDQMVSRQHVIFEARDSGVSVMDLNPTMGTYVNGKPISHLHSLKDNDEIKIGQTIFSFHKM